MEELTAIKTADGREFKPWASKETVQEVVLEAVQDPSSVTAIASEIASGKAAIASAINAKGGSASATESFTELAEAVEEIPNFDQWARLAGVLAESPATDSLSGYQQNLRANVTEIIDTQGFFKEIRNKTFAYWNLLEKIVMVDASLTNGYPQSDRRFESCTALKEARFPSSDQWGVQDFFNANALEILEFGTLNRGKDTYSLYAGYKDKLRNLIVGPNSDSNLSLSQWRAANVIAEGQSGIDELNNNLYNNLLTKLYDHSNDGQTRTLSIGWLANVTAENIAYANAKGWTLTT